MNVEPKGAACSIAGALLFLLQPLAGAAQQPAAPVRPAPPLAAPAPGAPAVTAAPAPAPTLPRALLYLSAYFGNETQPVKAGIHWRVFDEHAADDGTHPLVAESTDPAPTLSLPDGDYFVHAAFGLAAATKRVVIAGRPTVTKLVLNAGALRISGVIGDKPIPADRLSISLYVPERTNPEAKLVADNVASGEVVLLPEGTYHIVSTYLDTVGVGSLEPAGKDGNASNSVVTADIRVQTGKLMDTTLRHRAAVLTLKLVNAPNGEALADTTFTVLTPGGDVIRELIGAFPSLVLAEGEYVAIARHAGVTYQSNFKVQSGLDRDVEIVAQ